MKIGNYSSDNIETSLSTELWFDKYNFDQDGLKETKAKQLEIEAKRRNSYLSYNIDGKAYRRYDFSIIPDCGFLSSSDPLAKNVELKLSFDREEAKMSVLDYSSPDSEDHAVLKTPWVIKDCHSVTEYISSPDLRDHFETIDHSPLIYNYDECEVILRSLDQGETSIRLEAIHGGNMPSHLFAGILPSEAVQGSLEKSSTRFAQHNVKEFNINLNGHSVNGYPIKTEVGVGTYPLVKWIESTNRLHNNLAGSTLSQITFHDNFIWSHHFETEESSTGWISIDLKLKEAYDSNMTMVIWLVSPFSLSLDKFNQIEKLRI